MFIPLAKYSPEGALSESKTLNTRGVYWLSLLFEMLLFPETYSIVISSFSIVNDWVVKELPFKFVALNLYSADE